MLLDWIGKRHNDDRLIAGGDLISRAVDHVLDDPRPAPTTSVEPFTPTRSPTPSSPKWNASVRDFGTRSGWVTYHRV